MNAAVSNVSTPPVPPPHEPAADAALATERDVALLRDFLCDRDAGCPRCGYNLRNLTTARCPECGDTLALRVALVEPQLAAFVALLVALSLGLGGSLLFTMLALSAAPSAWWYSVCAKVMLIQLVACALALPFALAGRRRFRRLPYAHQWLLATVAALAVTAMSAVIIVAFKA